MLCFVDENSIVPMESAQDYKRVFDGDKGPQYRRDGHVFTEPAVHAGAGRADKGEDTGSRRSRVFRKTAL